MGIITFIKLITSHTMKFLPLLSLISLTTACTTGRWGSQCNNICGACSDNSGCNVDTGACPTKLCETGWSGDNCDVAFCDKSGCEDRGGHCIAPNVCSCPINTPNTVVSVNEVDGKRIVSCDNLKISGSKGALVALIILTASITSCGAIERYVNKGKKVGRDRFKD